MTLLAFAWVGLGFFPRPLLANPENTSTALLDREGKILRITLTGDEMYRIWTPLDAISSEAIAATLSYEDRWFWYHPGFNPLSFTRAVVQNFRGSSRRPLGASTITMQLVRNRFRLYTRSLLGKLRQTWLALLVERHYSKREILEAYLNTAPYGANIEGLGAAARIYYRIPPAKLSASQAKLLALIPQNPNRRAPTSSDNQSALTTAWARNFPDEHADTVVGSRSDLLLLAPHLSDRVRALSNRRGEVKTTLDRELHGITERIVRDFIERNQTLGFSNATALIVDSKTMEVLAYVGSAGYTNSAIQGYVNGLNALRSPGSALKPFIYALAIDQGLITPDSLLKDTPLRIANYQPENFERNFLGPLSATEALVRSRNIPAVQLARSLKEPGLHEFFLRAGFSLPRSAEYYGLSLALGTFEVSMEQILAAYAMLGEGKGIYRPLSWFGPSHEPGKRLLSPQASYLTRQMLLHNPRPHELFGARSFTNTPPIAWKTGTSFGAKDAWAIGIVDSLIVGVWIGNFDGSPNPNFVGRDAAGPLLFSVIEGVHAQRGLSSLPPPLPDGLKHVDVCALSGSLASPHCPHTRKGWIVAGVSPRKVCSVHREIVIDSQSGLRVCRESDSGHTTRKVFEVWDTDLLRLFSMAGLSRQVPPPFMKLCNMPASSDQSPHPPHITSPQEAVAYTFKGGGDDRIEFSAVNDGGGRSLFWFVDTELVGEGSTIFWRARPGRFTVRVTDDQGQSAQTTMVVKMITMSAG